MFWMNRGEGGGKVSCLHPESTPMAKPNYQFEKRQRELQKKQKKEEKAQRKALGGPAEPTSPAALPAEQAPPSE